MPDKDICGEHSKAIEILEKDQESQWAAIDKLRNRLPVWATMLIATLTFSLGFMLNYAFTAVRMTAMIK